MNSQLSPRPSFFSNIFRLLSGSSASKLQQVTVTSDPFDNPLRNVKAEALQAKAGTVNLKYDPTLIPTLTEQHKVLVSLFIKIETDAKKDSYQTANENLKRFYKNFGIHLYRENLQLYGFLRQMEDRSQISDEDANLTRAMKQQMTTIQNTVKREIERFIGNGIDVKRKGIDESNKNDFLKTWSELKPILVHRVETEEQSLYMVYESFKSE